MCLISEGTEKGSNRAKDSVRKINLRFFCFICIKWAIRTIFSLFSSFQYRLQFKFADDCIRTADIRCRMRPLYQLSYNLWPKCFFNLTIARLHLDPPPSKNIPKQIHCIQYFFLTYLLHLARPTPNQTFYSFRNSYLNSVDPPIDILVLC